MQFLAGLFYTWNDNLQSAVSLLFFAADLVIVLAVLVGGSIILIVNWIERNLY